MIFPTKISKKFAGTKFFLRIGYVYKQKSKHLTVNVFIIQINNALSWEKENTFITSIPIGKYNINNKIYLEKREKEEHIIGKIKISYNVNA